MHKFLAFCSAVAESAIYAKVCAFRCPVFISVFLGILNSKKRKIRELRDQLSKNQSSEKWLQEQEGSTDKTESFDEVSGDRRVRKNPQRKLPALQRMYHQVGAVVERRLLASSIS